MIEILDGLSLLGIILLFSSAGAWIAFVLGSAKFDMLVALFTSLFWVGVICFVMWGRFIGLYESLDDSSRLLGHGLFYGGLVTTYVIPAVFIRFSNSLNAYSQNKWGTPLFGGGLRATVLKILGGIGSILLGIMVFMSLCAYSSFTSWEVPTSGGFTSETGTVDSLRMVRLTLIIWVGIVMAYAQSAHYFTWLVKKQREADKEQATSTERTAQ